MEPDTSPADGAVEDLSLREASRLYDVELPVLQRLARRGHLAAHKVRGPWGREWRVAPAAVEGMGYPRRPVDDAPGAADDLVPRLERELAAARRAAAAERTRADDADRRLGEALLQAGRLRAALAAAEGAVVAGPPGGDGLVDVDLDELRHVLVDLRAGRRAAHRR